MPDAPQSLSPAALVGIEADALQQLARRLAGPQASAFEALLRAARTRVEDGNRIVLTGMGKSGLIARKIAATLTSLSVPSGFLHPAEALHGDLGLLRPGDALLALSYSGETEELVRLLPALARLQVTLLCFTGCPASTLARSSAATVDASVDREACTHQLAPTASTTAMLALGDAFAVTLAGRLGFAPQTFAELHPGGALGRRLTPVEELMHSGDAVPIVTPEAPMPEIIHEMSRKRLGMTTVQDARGHLLGIISDGDLRRLFETKGQDAFHLYARDVMTAHPRTITSDMFAGDALTLMEQHKITALIVTGSAEEATTVRGVAHLHDLWSSRAAAHDPAQPGA